MASGRFRARLRSWAPGPRRQPPTIPGVTDALFYRDGSSKFRTARWDVTRRLHLPRANRLSAWKSAEGRDLRPSYNKSLLERVSTDEMGTRVYRNHHCNLSTGTHRYAIYAWRPARHQADLRQAPTPPNAAKQASNVVYLLAGNLTTSSSFTNLTVHPSPTLLHPLASRAISARQLETPLLALGIDEASHHLGYSRLRLWLASSAEYVSGGLGTRWTYGCTRAAVGVGVVGASARRERRTCALAAL